MDPTLHSAIERTQRAAEVAVVVGEWEQAALLAQRLSVYCTLAARAETQVPTDP